MTQPCALPKIIPVNCDAYTTIGLSEHIIIIIENITLLCGKLYERAH